MQRKMNQSIQIVSLGRRLIAKSTNSQYVKKTFFSPNFTRPFSFSSDRVSVETNSDAGIATLKMHNRPVNSMGYQFLQEATNALKGLEKENYRAVIMTSSIPKVFCAGLDFNELVNPKQERLTKYWKLFEEFIGAVYGSKLAVIAAINGVAPAGGCVLSLASDYRIMDQQSVIGLNEVAIGLPLHSWIIQMCANVTGMRNAELAGLTGELYKSDVALKMGFVDQVAVDNKELLEKALRQAKVYASSPNANIWHITKMEGRRSILDCIKNRDAGDGAFIASINSPPTQKILTDYAMRFKKK